MVCKNCKTSLGNTNKFCPECGAKVIKNKLTAKNLSVDISEQFFSYDNKFIKTLIALFKKPEDVINSYINGTRKKYISVIQYFAISLTFVAIQIFLMNTFFKEAINFEEFITIPSNISEENSKMYEDIMSSYLNIFQNYQNLIYIFSVPIGAFASFIAFKFTGIKKFNFIEHLVINMYFSAQTIIVFAVLQILFLVLGLNFVVVSTLITVLSFAYYFYIFQRVFSLSLIENFAKMLITFIMYSILFFILVMLVLILITVVKLKNGG